MTNAVSDPLIGYLLDDRYEVVERIARGGMATVYRAIDHRLDRDVAIKVMHAHLTEGGEFVARFRREARAAARLVHPGIVAVYDQGTAGDAPYLVMELIDGPNLRQVLTDRKALPIGEALDIVEQVLDALAAAHREGFVHRDIKPENVLIAHDRAKLADFGLARTISEVTAATTGTVLGTVAYLSPELVSQGQADARSDVYAVGIMAYEMIMGAQPYLGDSAIAVAFQHINSTVPRPSDTYSWIPVEVDEVIASLTAKDPDERPPDAGAAVEIVRHLRRGLDDKTLLSAIPIARPPSASTPRHRPTGLEGGSTAQVPLASGRQTTPLPSAAGRGGTAMSQVDADGAQPSAVAAPGTSSNHTTTATAVQPRRRRRRWRIVVLILVLLLVGGGGGGAWWYFTSGPGSLVAVPDVLGKPKADAEAALELVGLKPVYSEDHSDTVPEGDVIKTAPQDGTKVDPGTEVDVVVSSGELRIMTPDVRGQTQVSATQMITDAGLKVGQVTDEYSTSTASGVVISQSPIPGAGDGLQGHSQPVNLVVSKGPEPIDIPDFADMSQAEAQTRCSTAELNCTFGDAQFSDTVAQGRVMSQSLEANSAGHRGDAIELILSKGPDVVQVPNVVTKSKAEATEILTKAGFKVSVTEDLAEPPLNLVVQQSPKALEWAPRGDTVTIKIV